MCVCPHALAAATAPRQVAEVSKSVATGCGVMKGQPDPPLLPDDQYPEWLWTLLKPSPTVKELLAKYESKGLNMYEVRCSTIHPDCLMMMMTSCLCKLRFHSVLSRA